MSIDQLMELPGVGPATARALIDAGFDDPESIRSASIADLIAVPGFAESRAQALLDASAAFAAAPDAPVSASTDDSSDAGEAMAETPAVESTLGASEQRGKKRSSVRKKLKREVEALEERRAKVKADIKSAKRRLKKASSKKKQSKRSDELARLRRKSEKLTRRIDALLAERSQSN